MGLYDQGYLGWNPGLSPFLQLNLLGVVQQVNTVLLEVASGVLSSSTRWVSTSDLWSPAQQSQGIKALPLGPRGTDMVQAPQVFVLLLHQTGSDRECRKRDVVLWCTKGDP